MHSTSRESACRAELLKNIEHLPPFTFLDARHAAAILGTSPGVLANWRSQRRGPPYCGNGHFVRYQYSALMDWINRRASEVPHASETTNA